MRGWELVELRTIGIYFSRATEPQDGCGCSGVRALFNNISQIVVARIDKWGLPGVPNLIASREVLRCAPNSMSSLVPLQGRCHGPAIAAARSGDAGLPLQRRWYGTSVEGGSVPSLALRDVDVEARVGSGGSVRYFHPRKGVQGTCGCSKLDLRVKACVMAGRMPGVVGGAGVMRGGFGGQKLTRRTSGAAGGLKGL